MIINFYKDLKSKNIWSFDLNKDCSISLDYTNDMYIFVYLKQGNIKCRKVFDNIDYAYQYVNGFYDSIFNL